MGQKLAKMDPPLIKILSLNLAGGTLFLHDLLPQHRPDILLVQEVLLQSEELLNIVQPYGYTCETNTDPVNSTRPGTAVIWRTSLPVIDTKVIVESRLQSLTIGDTTFINIYAPSGSNRRREREQLFATELFQTLATAGQTTLPWLAGDWNCLVEESQTTANFRDKRSPALSNLLRNYRYTDVFSHLHPGDREYTFHRRGVAQSRLDRVYCPPDREGATLSVVHIPGLSDHSGVLLEMRMEVQALPPPPCIKTYWKINTSILEDSRFNSSFRSFYENLHEQWRTEHRLEIYKPSQPTNSPFPGGSLQSQRLPISARAYRHSCKKETGNQKLPSCLPQTINEEGGMGPGGQPEGEDQGYTDVRDTRPGGEIQIPAEYGGRKSHSIPSE